MEYSMPDIIKSIELMCDEELAKQMGKKFPGWFGIEIPLGFSQSPISEIYIAEITFRKSEKPEYTYGALLWGQPPGYLRYVVQTYEFKSESDIPNRGEMVQCLPIEVCNGKTRYFPNILRYGLEPGPVSDFLYPSFAIIKALKEAKEIGQFNVHYSLIFEGMTDEEQKYIENYFDVRLNALQVRNLSGIFGPS